MAVSSVGKSDSQIPVAHCEQCGATDKKLLQCSRCHFVQYCDVSCQKLHWPTHKPVCTKQQGGSTENAAAAIQPKKSEAVNETDRLLAKNEGFVYIIKNSKGDELATLCGTNHTMLPGWKGINKKTEERLKNSEKVITECNLLQYRNNKIGDETLEQSMTRKGSVDWNILTKASQHNIPIIGLETFEEQVLALQKFINEIAKCTQGKIMPPEYSSKAVSGFAQNWLDGREDLYQKWNVQTSFIDLGFNSLKDVPTEVLTAHKNFNTDRSKTYAIKIITELKDKESSPKTSKLLFLPLGSLHFFDFAFEKGVISWLEQSGYTAVRERTGN